MFSWFKKKTKNPEPLVSRIFPRIKHQNFISALTASPFPEDQMPYTEPLVGDLLLTYAFDMGDAFAMATRKDIASVGLMADKVREVAVANLKASIGTGGWAGDPPVLQIVLGNNFDACALLMDEIWDQLAANIPPEIIVGVPHRDVVLVTTTGSEQGSVEKLRELVADIHARDEVHGLTRDLLVRRNAKWEVFEKGG